jgi:hypothetical protein
VALSAWLAPAQCVTATDYVTPAQHVAVAKRIAPAWLASFIIT